MRTIQEEYKFFIENCTSTPKSYRNYSDFSRICKTLAQLKRVENFNIYSCTTPDEMEANIHLLESNTDFIEYNKKGGNQYSNALSTYLRFLKARQFFKTTESLPIETDSFRSPLQQIFYGAPGTGKSHTIKESLGKVPKENIFRTTFHPDSDYSTFVGAYKPTMQKQIDRIYTKDELISKLTEMKEGGITYSTQKFGAKYWRSLKSLSLSDKKEILQACGMSDNYTVEFDKGVAIGEENLIGSKESRIVYSFVAQAFLHAYLQAYRKSDENVYLIIEEINRGNCAQIFGDLFQLLDRNEQGSSEYAIKADADIKAYLEEELGADNPGIRNGELCLPANLFIWATMNTSDQSLFPIDSAFKRRWEWKYIPICNAEKGWSIEAGGNKYDWWSFLNSINCQIQDVTSSEDKKLGYFFVKADADGVITADKFVGKVAFYLWNDVFKDYGFDGEIFQGESGEPIAFQDFFLCDGKANEATVERFLKNLGAEAKETGENTTATEI